MSSHIHPLKTKVKKPKSKGTKADSVEKVTVAELLPELENTEFHLDDQPYASLFKIYKKEFLDSSVDKGLIHKNALALAGISCTCDNPCSDAKHGRTVHLVMNDNPRLFNNPPRSSKEWKLEFNARTSAERSNKREKLDFSIFFVPHIIFTFQSTMPEFSWHDHSRFREIIVIIFTGSLSFP